MRYSGDPIPPCLVRSSLRRHPQLLVLPVTRSRALISLNCPQEQWQPQTVTRPLVSALNVTLSRPNVRPVRSIRLGIPLILSAFLFLFVGIYALVPSCAVTQKSIMSTQINVVTPCNTWIWVRSASGQPIAGVTVYGSVGSAATDERGYACFLLKEPTAFRVDAGAFFLPQDVLLWPSETPREVRLSWVSRAN